MPHIKTVGEFRKAIRQGPYAWPGGYDIFFITSDGGVLCHTCAEDERSQVLWSIANKVHDGWKVEAVDASCNVDSLTVCDHCSRIIVDDSEGHGPVDAFGADPEEVARAQAEEEAAHFLSMEADGTIDGMYPHFRPDE